MSLLELTSWIPFVLVVGIAIFYYLAARRKKSLDPVREVAKNYRENILGRNLKK